MSISHVRMELVFVNNDNETAPWMANYTTHLQANFLRIRISGPPNNNCLQKTEQKLSQTHSFPDIAKTHESMGNSVEETASPRAKRLLAVQP
ncbi:hypothetical protein FEM48_Zijuj10G0104700 [Ziziphus jujuba var. spinosa]|uniref:Uncharacterized protein n=1 Tax=Ziziphus jujuba var. spinosa TaxID=714518 RepID=A0A978UMU9_ZIZJJ|nr:hypothetical protein FEM48_Zijuj10G0104700 [Ziziphus jujuba var. spinosa]